MFAQCALKVIYSSVYASLFMVEASRSVIRRLQIFISDLHDRDWEQGIQFAGIITGTHVTGGWKQSAGRGDCSLE